MLAPSAAVCRELAQRVAHAKRSAPALPPPPPPDPRARRAAPARDTSRRARGALSRDAVVVEEAPVDDRSFTSGSRAERLGFLSAAMGGSVRGRRATGVAWRCPSGRSSPSSATARRSTGSGLWSAAHYRVGVLFVILSNGGYAIMDRLAERTAGDAPWPGFGEVEVAAVARGRLPGRGGSRRTTSSCARSTRSSRRSRHATSRSCSTSRSPRRCTGTGRRPGQDPDAPEPPAAEGARKGRARGKRNRPLAPWAID